MSLRHVETLDKHRNLSNTIKRIFGFSVITRHEPTKPLTKKEKENLRKMEVEKELAEWLEAYEYNRLEMESCTEPDTREFLQVGLKQQEYKIKQLREEIEMIDDTINQLSKIQ